MTVKELNDNSKTISEPDGFKLKLRKHQQAMLYKCLTIENQALIDDTPFCIMSDKAGAGKTAVIIGLILADKILNGRTQNIIIVPQNIYTQWIGEIEKFAGDSLSVSTFVDYSSITELYYNPDILLESDIIITTILYYETVMTTLQQNDLYVKRLILDEIDSMNNIIDSIKNKEKIKKQANKQLHNDKELSEITELKSENNKLIWLVSASINKSITSNGLIYQDYLISNEKLDMITCKCEDDFVDKYNFTLEKPEIITKIFGDVSDDFFNFLSVQQLDNINSLSFHSICSSFIDRIAGNSIEAIEIIANDYNISIQKSIENLKVLNKYLKLIENNKKRVDEYKVLKSQIEAETSLQEFNIKILDNFYNIVCNDENKMDFDNKFESIKYNLQLFNEKYIESKSSYMNDIFKNIDKQNDKILIFSDFTESFKTISQLLVNNCIKYSELNGGNYKSIDKAIDDYKNKDSSVLLIDSSSEGCGMNLENTTHLIFLHKTSEILYNQIIGRAQRPGRTNKLKIITLLHENEKIE